MEKGDELKFYLEKAGKQLLVVQGAIVEIDRPRLLEHTLFPSTWDMEDRPENYLSLRYLISAKGDHLSITQSGFEQAAQGEKRYREVVKGWETSLPKLKAVAES